jgi:hypothetical protein
MASREARLKKLEDAAGVTEPDRIRIILLDFAALGPEIPPSGSPGQGSMMSMSTLNGGCMITSIEHRLRRLESAVAADLGGPPPFGEYLREMLRRALERRRLGLPPYDAPIELDRPLADRLRQALTHAAAARATISRTPSPSPSPAGDRTG